MNTLAFVILPYVCLAIFVVGHWWRYKYDKFGWTTRSSQLYEDNLLKWGSPLFHFGMLGVVGGHVIGLIIPESWTDWAGLSEHTYHLFAITGGIIAGLMAVTGLVMLVYRRRTVAPVFRATTVMDKVMYLMLGTVIALGMWNTLASGVLDPEFNYRTTVSPWFRGIFYGMPDASLMAGVPVGFKIHAIVAFLLFALWPFTRLVHVFSAPLGYLTRPYIVYRSRADHVRTGLGNRSPQPGWERPGLDRVKSK